MNDVRCHYCIAAWGDIFGENGCDHNERHVEVARQIAGRIHETDAPTDQQIGWFLEDAETVCAVVPDEHPLVKWMPRTMRLVVNGHRFRVADEGGELMYVGGPIKPRAVRMTERERDLIAWRAT